MIIEFCVVRMDEMVIKSLYLSVNPICRSPAASWPPHNLLPSSFLPCLALSLQMAYKFKIYIAILLYCSYSFFSNIENFQRKSSLHKILSSFTILRWEVSSKILVVYFRDVMLQHFFLLFPMKQPLLSIIKKYIIFFNSYFVFESHYIILLYYNL